MGDSTNQHCKFVDSSASKETGEFENDLNNSGINLFKPKKKGK
jgi:hypothetical protein